MQPVRSIGNEAKKRGVYDFRDWRHRYGGGRNCTIALAKRHCHTRTRSQSEKREKSASHHLDHRRSGEARDITSLLITMSSGVDNRAKCSHDCAGALEPRDAPPFRVVLLFALAAAGTFFGGLGGASAQSHDAAFRIEVKIPLGDVRGRIDHMAVDLNRKRLFVAELGNNTVAIVDVGQAKVLQVLGGQQEPQGVGYLPSTDTLYVANGGDGSLRLFQGPNYTASGRIDLGNDADNVRVDQSSQHIVVGYGDGALALIDGAKREKIGDIRLPAHPEGFQLDPSTSQAYVNLPNARSIAVANLSSGKVTALWPVGGASANFPMAVDSDSNHVLVVF